MRWILFAVLVTIAAPAHTAVIVVDTLADGITGPLCDIRDAIAAANLDHAVGGCEQGGDGDDVIDLSGLTGTLDLDSALPNIKSNVTLQAAGPSQFAISGQGASRIFRVTAGNVILRNMTIKSGLADRGAAVWADPSSPTSVRIESCRITGNSAGTGAAIANDGASVVIDRSLIDGNAATDPGGAALLNASGSLVIENTTISGNGGGVASLDAQTGPDTTTSINATTLYRNTNDARINLFNQTGAVTRLTHTLLSAAGTNGSNCSGPLVSDGYNIADDASCSLAALGDQGNVNVAVDSLAANGGPTATHALQGTSPALDGGVLSPCVGLETTPLVVDQRGFPRGTDGNLDDSFRCDVGAYEAPGPLPAPEPATPLLAAAACLSLRSLARARRKRAASPDPQP